MKNNKIFMRVFISVIMICTLLVSIFTCSVNNVHAKKTNLSQEEISVLKQNILYKAIYANLIKCYSEMKSSFDESSIDTSISYNSDTYFSEQSLDKKFLKFPDGVGKKNESSCPDMITGWNTNWLIDLFKNIGSFDGLAKLNRNAKVPGLEISSIDDLGSFFENIGYIKKETEKSINGRRCFYVKFNIPHDTANKYFLSETLDGKPIETVDFCAKVNADGKIPIESGSIISLSGNNDYFGTNSSSDPKNINKSGHLTNNSNIAFIDFGGKLYPDYYRWEPSKIGEVLGKKESQYFLDANINSVDFRYKSKSNNLEDRIIIPKNITKNNASTDCLQLGYKKCGVFEDWSYASLTDGNEKINYGDFKNGIVNILRNARDDEGVFLFDNVSSLDYGPKERIYNRGTSTAKYLNYFLKDVSSYNGGNYSDAEKYILYWNYLKDHYNVLSKNSRVDNAVQVSWLNDDGTFEKLYIYDPDEDLNDKRYVLEGGTKWSGTTTGNWKWIAEQLAKIDVEKAFAVKPKNIVDSDVDPRTAETEAKSEAELLQEGCFNNAGSLGWIICPAIFGLHNVSKGVYNTVEPLLQVHENIIDQLGRQDSEIFKAWSTFRNFANIIFAIFFLVIIFSQITGYGIDNYGIKKILPKLIITAILVNLSFIICAIAVDISNIVGSSIKGLFEGLGNNQLGGSAIGAQGHLGDKILHYFVLASGTVAAGAVAIAVSGWALLIPILLFFLTAAISILFAFIILGLRQALIIILIVSAPIAIILSALPNTKTIYNKWFSLFKGVLMVYPIIGALVGVGYFTSTIIYAGGSAKEGESSGFIMSIVAGLLSVVPYLMIPSVTRKSLDAVGSLGTKISGFGDRLGKGAKSRINNTEAVKTAKANSAASMARFRAKRFMNSEKAREIENDIKNGNKVSVRRANKYARAAELANSDRNALLTARVAESKYNRLSSDTGFSAAMSSAADAEEGTEVKNYETLIRNSDFVDDNGKTVNFQNTSEIQTALEQELSRGEDKVDTAKIRALQNVLASKGDNGRNSIFKAMENAQNRGDVSSKAIKAFSSNIMNNQGDYKNQHRSLYEYAKTTAADGVNRDSSKHGGSSKISSFATDGIQALTADSFLSADKTQIDAYRKAYQNNELSTEDRAKLEQIAHSIANNPNVHSKIRTDDYGEALQAFAPDAEWNAIYSGGVKIDHSSTSTSSNGDTGNSENSNNSNAGTNGNTDQGQSGGQTPPQNPSQDRIHLSSDEIANLNANIDAARRAGINNPEIEATLRNIQQNGENRSSGGIILP